jgi:hypothetical protein
LVGVLGLLARHASRSSFGHGACACAFGYRVRFAPGVAAAVTRAKFQAFPSDQEQGVNIFTIELQAKCLGLLHELLIHPH